jgi:membrane protease YdiL (CAAX protease family)
MAWSEFGVVLGISTTAFVILILAQAAVLAAKGASAWRALHADESRGISELLADPTFQAQLVQLGANGDVLCQAAFWSALACSPFILLATWLWKRRAGLAGLLALRLPEPKATVRIAGIFVLLILALEGIARISPAFRTSFMEDVMSSSTQPLMLFLGVGLAAPICEELLFRGLLLGGFRLVWDKHVAVAVSAGIFTLLHPQYEVTVQLLILPLGVVLGYARTNTGSLWVPIALHVMNNSASLALAATV